MICKHETNVLLCPVAEKVCHIEGKVNTMERMLATINAVLLERLPGKTQDDQEDSSDHDDSGPSNGKGKKKFKMPCANLPHITDGSEARLLLTYASVYMLTQVAYTARNRGEQSHIRGAAVRAAWEQVFGDGAKVSGDQIRLKDAASKKTTNHFVAHRIAAAQFTQNLFCNDLRTARFNMMVQKMWGLNLTDPVVKNIWHEKADFTDTNSDAHGSMWQNEWMTDLFRKGNWRRFMVQARHQEALLRRGEAGHH